MFQDLVDRAFNMLQNAAVETSASSSPSVKCKICRREVERDDGGAIGRGWTHTNSGLPEMHCFHYERYWGKSTDAIFFRSIHGDCWFDEREWSDSENSGHYDDDADAGGSDVSE